MAALLSRALKVAKVAKLQAAATGAARAALESGHVRMYIDVLEQYVYYFERGVDGFAAAELQPVIDLVIAEVSAAPKDSEAVKHWQRALKGFEQAKSKADGDAKARWNSLSIPS